MRLKQSSVTEATEEMHFFYDAESHPQMVEYNGNTYTYAHDQQGNIVGMLDAAGALVVKYAYYAWGNPTEDTSTLTSEYLKLHNRNPFRYRGYTYDEETGAYYLRNRYYNAEWGGFLNIDRGIDGRHDAAKHLRIGNQLICDP